MIYDWVLMVVYKKDCCDGMSDLSLRDIVTMLDYLEPQGSEAWLRAREECHATASEFSTVCGRNYFTSCEVLMQQKLNILDGFCGNSATRYGQQCESVAVQEYEVVKAVRVEKAGLVIHPVHCNFGGSPDGFVGEEGMIEVKCPYKYRHKSVLPRHRVCPRQYRDQIQGLMEITNREWCDLVVWCPRDMVVVRVKRDRDYWNKEILPDLLSFSRELQRRKKELTEVIDSGVDVFASEFSVVCKRNVFMNRTKMYRKKMAQWVKKHGKSVTKKRKVQSRIRFKSV